jgi:hypothetical protein
MVPYTFGPFVFRSRASADEDALAHWVPFYQKQYTPNRTGQATGPEV